MPSRFHAVDEIPPTGSALEAVACSWVLAHRGVLIPCCTSFTTLTVRKIGQMLLSKRTGGLQLLHRTPSHGACPSAARPGRPSGGRSRHACAAVDDDYAPSKLHRTPRNFKAA